MPPQSAVTPESAPTVQQLIAFYLEAGVDCALREEPLDRLSDPENIPRLSEPALAQPIRTAVPVSGGRIEAAPGTEAAILSAREAARSAPTLEALRALLETPTRASCLSAMLQGGRKTSKACRLSALPANCWTA
jgi:uracil-DNA glycosylase